MTGKLREFVGEVFCMNALRLLQALPTESIDAVIADAMYGVGNFRYEWGLDPSGGDLDAHWEYHRPILEQCRRVLRPGGVLAWGQSFKSIRHFDRWFGEHRIWSPSYAPGPGSKLTFQPNIWVVQSREGEPISHPNDMLVSVNNQEFRLLRKRHPCPKPVEEMVFLIERLTQPGDVLLDCFCGVGSTLVAAQRLNRSFVGCDLSRTYCQIAMHRLALDRNE